MARFQLDKHDPGSMVVGPPSDLGFLGRRYFVPIQSEPKSEQRLYRLRYDADTKQKLEHREIAPQESGAARPSWAPPKVSKVEVPWSGNDESEAMTPAGFLWQNVTDYLSLNEKLKQDPDNDSVDDAERTLDQLRDWFNEAAASLQSYARREPGGQVRLQHPASLALDGAGRVVLLDADLSVEGGQLPKAWSHVFPESKSSQLCSHDNFSRLQALGLVNGLKDLLVDGKNAMPGTTRARHCDQWHSNLTAFTPDNDFSLETFPTAVPGPGEAPRTDVPSFWKRYWIPLLVAAAVVVALILLALRGCGEKDQPPVDPLKAPVGGSDPPATPVDYSDSPPFFFVKYQHGRNETGGSNREGNQPNVERAVKDAFPNAEVRRLDDDAIQPWLDDIWADLNRLDTDDRGKWNSGSFPSASPENARDLLAKAPDPPGSDAMKRAVDRLKAFKAYEEMKRTSRPDNSDLFLVAGASKAFNAGNRQLTGRASPRFDYQSMLACYQEPGSKARPDSSEMARGTLMLPDSFHWRSFGEKDRVDYAADAIIGKPEQDEMLWKSAGRERGEQEGQYQYTATWNYISTGAEMKGSIDLAIPVSRRTEGFTGLIVFRNQYLVSHNSADAAREKALRYLKSHCRVDADDAQASQLFTITQTGEKHRVNINYHRVAGRLMDRNSPLELSTLQDNVVYKNDEQFMQDEDRDR